MKKSLSILISGEFFKRDYLINKKRFLKEVPHYSPNKKAMSLDKKDEVICSFLSKNSRISSVEIAEKMNLSPDAVIQRINKLKREGIISGHNIILNQEKMEQAHYKILIYTSNLSKEKEENLFQAIRKNNRVISLVKPIAEWDYEVDIEVENFSQLKEFTFFLTNNFSNVIRDYSSLRILKMPKYNLYPMKP